MTAPLRSEHQDSPAPLLPVNQQKQHSLVTYAEVLLFCVGSLGLACGPSHPPSESGGKGVAAKDRVILIAAERSSLGGRLVRVSSNGARQSPVTKLPALRTTLDRSPVLTPDGAFLIFASNRERDNLASTSLWIVPSAGGPPSRLTEGAAIDRDPRLSSDGKWLYFCSNREGSFDIYRAELDVDRSQLGQAQQVTHSEGQVLSPSLSPDGLELAYMAVDESGKSAIWSSRVDGDGGTTQLTAGPMDMTPAWGAEGVIAFASQAAGRQDADLFLMESDGSQRRVLVDAAQTDETGPRWSNDGRFLFAIGTYRSATDGKPLLGSIVFVDMEDKSRTLRALHDPAAVESRIGLALMPASLDPKLMRRNASYADALHKVLLRSAVQNESQKRKQKQKQKTSK